MSNRFRQIVAAVAAVLLLSTAFTTTAMAQTRTQDEAAHAPAVVDVLLLRPAGFVSLVVGTGLFLALTPIVLVTRPHEIAKPFNELVARPARFLWKDPLGGH
ncbi:MAG: hypothetical protein AB8G23_03460 [Myxococcota bacterium]